MFRPFLIALAILPSASLSPLLAQNDLFVGPSTLTFNANVGGAPTNTQFISASSTGTPVSLNVVVEYIGSTVQWLTATPSSGTTPFNVSVSANPANLPTGQYQARVNFFGSFGASVLVSFIVTGGSGGASTLTASPASITVTASTTGGVVTQQLTINTATGVQTGYSITTSASGGNWLSVFPVSGTTPSFVNVTMNPAGLLSQAYSGSVIITPTTGGPALTVPVTLNINGVTSGFTISATTIPVNYQLGAAYPPQQSLFVNNSAGQISYTANSSAAWALLSTAQNPVAASTVSGQTGSSLLININPAGLSAGSYPATITLVASTGQTLSATVVLNISTSGFFVANPNTLSFNYLPGNVPPNSQPVSVTSSTGVSINFSATASSNGGWLAVTPNFGNTTSANQLTISILPVTLTPGTYTGMITLTDAVSAVSTTIPVTLNYGTAGGTNQLSITPASVFFQAPVGSPAQSQTVQVVAISGVSQNFTVAAAPPTNWLSAAPGVGVTPATITVVAVPTLVAGVGTYTGNLTFNNFDGTQQTLTVTLNVTSNSNLAAVPNSLAFTQAVGAPLPAAQQLQISTSNGLNSAFAVTTSAAWLTAAPNAGTTPASVTVSASAANLAPGTYSGTVSITGGISGLKVPVSFTVLSANSIALSTTSINFTYQAGAAAPAPQVINVNTGGASIPFISGFATAIGGNWLSISQSAGTTPATVTVSVNPVSLASGIYPGTVTISASDGSGQKATVNVFLTVTAPPAPQISVVLHAATNQPTWLTPGLIIVIQGIGLGPATIVNGTLLAPGAVDTIAGGTRVLFDGVPAPILAAKSDGILAVVPYQVRGKLSSSMVVEYQGIQSAPFNLSVFDSAPGIFTRDGSGVGQAAIVNENGSLNSPANPAAPGSIVSVYATGEGDTKPTGQEGRVIVTDLRVPILPVRFYLNGRELEILYAGSAPNFVSGAFQVNVRIPQNLSFNGSLPIELQVGSRGSQSNITMAIR